MSALRSWRYRPDMRALRGLMVDVRPVDVAVALGLAALSLLPILSGSVALGFGRCADDRAAVARKPAARLAPPTRWS